MKDVSEWKALAQSLDSALQGPSEQRIHTFLEAHPRVLDFLHWDGFLKSKFRLGDAFVPDFLAVGLEPHRNDPRPMVTFVEIERANEALFAKSGDPTSFLTHAIKQTQDWKRWVADNRTYLQTTLTRLVSEEWEASDEAAHPWRRESIKRNVSHGFTDRYLVIAGRRASMRLEDRLVLSQMNGDLQGIRIITYDVLLEAILQKVDQMQRGRSWTDIERW